jgi:RHS repeat-associated protein
LPLNFNPAAALTSLLYSGEIFDQRIEMQYLRARYYNPASGTFNRLDPFAGRIRDPQSLHKYLYVHADPIQGIDPSGLAGEPDQLARGKAAHKIITAYYKLEHIGDLVEGGTKPWRGGRRWLVDITNFTKKTMAEIKSTNPAEIAKGQAKLAGYVAATNAAKVFHCNTWAPDLWEPSSVLRYFWLGAANPVYEDWYGVIVGNLNGVVTYELFQDGETVPEPVPVPVPVSLSDTAEETIRALERLRPHTTPEFDLIASYLAQATAFVLGGFALVYGGMALVTAVESARGGPQLYAGFAGRSLGGFALAF